MAFNSEEAVSQPPATAAVIAAASTPISTGVLTDDQTGTTDSEGGDPEIIERKVYVKGLCLPSTLVSASNHDTDVHGGTPARPNLISARSLIFESTHKNDHRRYEVLIPNGETELNRLNPQQHFPLLPRNDLIHMMVPNDKPPQMVDIACGAGNATIRGLE
ncbi:hypothetical protein V491_00177 [Pseudogymnoascus sp. VKM F-3775]|nr:hypothetical protein V491_00177 [Pseudogymnoascus sp. VKM F-3775]